MTAASFRPPLLCFRLLSLLDDDCVSALKDLAYSSSLKEPLAQMKTNRCACVKSITPSSPAPTPSYLLHSAPQMHVGAPLFLFSAQLPVICTTNHQHSHTPPSSPPFIHPLPASQRRPARITVATSAAAAAVAPPLGTHTPDATVTVSEI